MATNLPLEGVIQAGLVAADAGVDLVHATLGRLPHPERVRQERSAYHTPAQTVGMVGAKDDIEGKRDVD